MELSLFSKPACQQCKATVRKFDKHDLSYSSVDMSVDEVALLHVKTLGYLEAPVVTVHRDGELVDHWSGYRPDKIEALLAA